MHSFTSCLVHCVWSTKNREPCLSPDLRERLWLNLGGIAKQNQMKTLAIGGASDHVHILLSLPATSSVAKAMQLLKGNSSKWIREIFPTMHSFGWQALAQNKESLFCRVRQLLRRDVAKRSGGRAPTLGIYAGRMRPPSACRNPSHPRLHWYSGYVVTSTSLQDINVGGLRRI